MNIAKVLLTQVAVVMVAVVAAPVAVAPAVAMTIRQILALILVMNMPHGIKVHAVVHGHTVIRVILAIMAVAAVVQNVLAVIQTVAAMVQVYPVAINRAPRHVHGRHARLMRPVPTAVHQPAADNITVVRVMPRLQHVQSAYLVNQDIINLAAVVRHAVVINIIAPVEPARVYQQDIIQRVEVLPPEQVKQPVAAINIIAPVEPARVYHLDIIQRAAHPPREQVKQHAVVINIIAPVEPARVYQQDIIPQAAHPPPEQVKRNAPPAHIAVVELNTIARLAIPTLPPVQQPKPNAINPAPRHVHGRHAHLMRPVPTAVHQPAADNITVVRVMPRLQHVQSAYRVIPAITKAAAVVQHAVAINIIAPVEPARVYQQDIIQRAEVPPPERVKSNANLVLIAVAGLKMIVQRDIQALLLVQQSTQLVT